jgi:macrolide-specific efflux system membrane fusion protein
MSNRTRASGLVYVLGALCAGAIVAAILLVGPASGSQSSQTRTATAALGVVQSTVSGSGNLQAASQLDLGFRTSGTIERIDVTQGQHVVQGQLLATLDPQSAEVTLEQAKAALQSAQASLAKEEETGGEAAAGTGTGSSPTAKAAGISAAAAARPSTTSSATTPSSTAPAAAAPGTGTTPASTTPATGTRPVTSTPRATTTTTSPAAEPKAKEKEKETVSPATREANLASARAAVRSDKLTVQSDEQAVGATKLYAPESGTIASLSGQVGETVSGGGTSKASAGSSSSTGSGAATGGAAAAGRSGAGSSSSTSSSASSSSSSFAVLSDLSSMQLVVALSESEVGSVRDGQTATVTVEALSGRKVAAHVKEVAILSTSNSGVVSYDVTFALDQMEAGLKPGMSATAEVVVAQAEGVNVPTSAISRGSVTVMQSGRQLRRAVATGLAGNSTTIILSGLKAGEEVVLPSVSTSASASGTSSLRSRLGGLGGGALGGLGGGGAGALLRGGGG